MKKKLQVPYKVQITAMNKAMRFFFLDQKFCIVSKTAETEVVEKNKRLNW